MLITKARNRWASILVFLLGITLCRAAVGSADTSPASVFRAEPLDRIVAAVSAEASPAVVVDPGVGWERATVYARKGSGVEVRRHLAALFDYSWREVKDREGEARPQLAAGRARPREQSLRQLETRHGHSQL